MNGLHLARDELHGQLMCACNQTGQLGISSFILGIGTVDHQLHGPTLKPTQIFNCPQGDIETQGANEQTKCQVKIVFVEFIGKNGT